MKKSIFSLLVIAIFTSTLNAQVLSTTVIPDSAYQTGGNFAWGFTTDSTVFTQNICNNDDTSIYTELCNISANLFVEFYPSLPNNAVIQGFEVLMYRNEILFTQGLIHDTIARLIINGTISQNKAVLTDFWDTVPNPPIYTYGSNNNLWGFGGFSPGSVNKITFEHVAASPMCLGATIDQIALKVYYIASPVGIDEKSSKSIFSLFPNPTSQNLTIALTQELSNTAYTLTDLQGRIVMQGRVQGLQTTLNVQNLAKGMYVLQAGDQRQSVVIE